MSSDLQQTNLYQLKIDQGFRDLIRPLHKQEYLQLEENILADGCRDPIVTWNGIIIDGHNRYEICKKHELPFTTVSMQFDSREDVVVWICTNQLGRRNLSEEARKYLIGMQYENEKVIASRRNYRGINQYSPPEERYRLRGRPPKEGGKEYTAERIARENHISRCTVQKYARYANALEKIRSKNPGMFPKIVSGQYKISHHNVENLSTLTPVEMKKLESRLDNSSASFVQYKGTRAELGKVAEASAAPHFGVSVKDMPEYDPDAEIVGLTLTIPSWEGSISRVMQTVQLDQSSQRAKEQLVRCFDSLRSTVAKAITQIKEQQNGE